nr:hypothetical protein [Lachnospiraceae bacterium]
EYEVENAAKEAPQAENVGIQQPEENIRIQRAKWIQEELERRYQGEQQVLAQLMAEQEIIDGLNSAIDAGLERFEEGRKYNAELTQKLSGQVYALHGLTADKLQGMREYKNAYYKGISFGMFFLSVVLTVLCGILHGITAQITIFSAFVTGAEGALLTREADRGRVLAFICRVLYVLLFPMMLSAFSLFELKHPWYDMLLPYFVIATGVVLVLGTVSYFVYTPYREDKKHVGAARNTLKDIEKMAARSVRKNQKLRKKAEEQEERAAAKEEEKNTRVAAREERRRLKQEEKAALRAKNTVARLEKKEDFKAQAGEKWEDFKARFRKKKTPEIIEIVADSPVSPEAEPAAAEEEELNVNQTAAKEEELNVNQTDVEEDELNVNQTDTKEE